MFGVSLKGKRRNISVAVITYQSAATVIETLDSIVGQTYGAENIELIISDDASSDNTVQVIERWLAENKDHFGKVIFFSNQVNVGVSKNCNLAWNATTSEWIKTIAGDDILLPTCLADNIEYVSNLSHNDVAAVFSRMQAFKCESSGAKENLYILPSNNELHFFELSAKEQFKYLQCKGISGAPSAFINRNILAQTGYADERFPMMEDFPLWFKFTQQNFKLRLMDKVTVKYRIADSLSNSKMRLINEIYIEQIAAVEKKLVIPTLTTWQSLLKWRKLSWPYLAIKVSRIFRNKVTLLSRLFIMLVFLIKPGFITSQFHKVFKRS